MPAKKRAVKTRMDKEREKEDVKLLVFAGYGVREAARQVGVNEDTACQWSFEGEWMQQLVRIKELANAEKAKSSTAENVAFDLARTNKQNRAALAQIANLTVMRKLKTISEDEEHPGFAIDDASDFAATVKANAQIAGDWEQDIGNRFAIGLSINQVINSAQVIKLPAGATIRNVS